MKVVISVSKNIHPPPMPTYWHPPHMYQISGKDLKLQLSFWSYHVFNLTDGCRWMCYCSNVNRCFINLEPRISFSKYCWESGRKGLHRLGLIQWRGWQNTVSIYLKEYMLCSWVRMCIKSLVKCLTVHYPVVPGWGHKIQLDQEPTW